MTADQARQALMDHARILAERGLVARTWGNLSIRTGSSMIITPSGIAYEDLEASHLVEVSLADLSWSGPWKPSSEKELHRRVYLQRPDVQAVFHTHQNLASALAAARREIPVEDPALRKILGSSVPCAAYALPTTAPLAKAVGRVLDQRPASAILLANHGTVCMGTSPALALDAAQALESLAAAYLASCSPNPELAALMKEVTTVHMAVDQGPSEPPVAAAPRLAALGLLRSDYDFLIRQGTGFSRVDTEGRLHPLDGSAPGVADLLHPDMLGPQGPHGALLLARGPAATWMARNPAPLRPLLDDLAQMCGTALGVSPDRPRSLRLSRNSAVLVAGRGVLCAADNPYEASALAQVTEKSALAEIAAQALGTRHAISPVEALLMRFIYKTSYAKKARLASPGKTAP